MKFKKKKNVLSRAHSFISKWTESKFSVKQFFSALIENAYIAAVEKQIQKNQFEAIIAQLIELLYLNSTKPDLNTNT